MAPSVKRTADHLVYAGDSGNRFVPVWDTYQSKSYEKFKIAELNNIRKLKVSGNVYTSELTTDVPMYEVVFAMMLLDTATKWDVPLKLKLTLPEGMEPSEQKRTENLVSKPKLQWFYILAGEFKTDNLNDMDGTIRFSLDIESQNLNSGLVIKSVIVRLVASNTPPPAIKSREINPSDLIIRRRRQENHWSFNMIKDTTKKNTYLYVAELLDMVLLEVIGKFDASKLPIGSSYKVAFLIRLHEKDARGWDNNPVTLRLNDDAYQTMIDRSHYQGKEFKELKVGVITVSPATVADGIEFSLEETKSGVSKKGLIIKRVLLRPV